MEILNIHAPGDIDPYDSYGLLASRLACHVEELGAYANVFALGHRHFHTQTAAIRRITEQPIRPSLGGVFLGFPTSYHKYGPLSMCGARVAMTMFESTTLSRPWIEPLNQLDAVIVCSEFNVQTFAANGVTAPLYAVPLGIDELYQPQARTRERPFTFLAIGDRGKRKNALMVLEAFNQAFGDDTNYRLIIKYRDNTDGVRLECLNPNIEHLYQDMTADEQYRLYLDCDCMVFPSRGEGFGLPPREFAATGGIAIATNWSGLADDIDLWGLPLDYKLVPAEWGVMFKGEDMGMWAEPDKDHLTHLMKEVADNREYHQARAMRQAAVVHELYSWRDFAARVLAIWREALAYSYTASPLLV